MECKNCGSKNSQAVSVCVENEKKPFTFFSIILLCLGIFLTILGLILVFASCKEVNFQSPPASGQDNYVTTIGYTIENTLGSIIGKNFLIVGIISLLFFSLIRTLQPYTHETKTKIICLDCGATLFEQIELSDEDLERLKKDMQK